MCQNQEKKNTKLLLSKDTHWGGYHLVFQKPVSNFKTLSLETIVQERFHDFVDKISQQRSE